ncbi:MAG: hypothetical protein FWC82_03300, partial [Firmicutes bacterium]|nr:hypothetical protein [Bacillota bacterium]
MKKSTNNKTAAVSKTKDYTRSPPVRGRPVDYHKNVPTVRVDHLLLQKYDSKPLTRTKIKQQGKRAINDASSKHAAIAVPKTVEVSKQVALGGRGFSTGWRDGKIPMPPMKAADRSKKEQINITGPIVTV